ncbi:MAG: ScpA family protein [Actinomycetota bacterium]|nr:ScpA family protein [Actinomycetota bacterium]
MSFEVDTETYKGPIGLLLSLITVQKVDLWQLSISDLVDDYLSELERMRELDLEVATEFLVVASTLLELKCRRLFPSDQVEIDEEFAFFEERDLLIARLLEIKTYRDAASSFTAMMEAASRTVPHIGILGEPFSSLMPDLLMGVTPKRLADSLGRFLASETEQEVDISHLPEHPLSISEAAEDVIVRLMDMGKCSFADLLSQASTRFEVVVGFLAILELYRQSRVKLEQHNSLGEISIEWTSEQFSPEEIAEFLEFSGFDLGNG